jgi:hemerythrin-like domain-containing protein
MLERLESAAAALEEGRAEPESAAAVREAHRFLTTEVRRHNDDEESVLFDLLGEDAPCEFFVQEHRTLRRLEAELGRALDAGDPRGLVPRIARGIVELLRAHIGREEEVLFPMARSLLGERGLAVAAERLQRFREERR